MSRSSTLLDNFRQLRLLSIACFSSAAFAVLWVYHFDFGSLSAIICPIEGTTRVRIGCIVESGLNFLNVGSGIQCYQYLEMQRIL